jgi:prophage tail gpP-like protein
MPKIEEFASITVNGTVYRDWTTVVVRQRYGDSVSDFQFTCTEGAPLASNFASLKIKPGDACTIHLAGQLALTGYVTTRQASYDATSHGVIIIGRSGTMQAVDASTPVKDQEFKNTGWEAIARKVLGERGVGLVMRGASGPPFKRADPIPGETAFNFLERLARMRGLVLTDNEKGQLVADSGFNAGGSDTIKEGVNIKAARGTISNANLAGPYETLSQVNGDDNEWGKKASQIASTGGGGTGAAGGKRPLITVAEQPGRSQELTTRSNMEAGWREGEEITVEATVYGWLRPSGGLWQKAQAVNVISPMLLLNMPLYAQTIVFSQDNNGGTLTNLTWVKTLTAGVDNLGGLNGGG